MSEEQAVPLPEDNAETTPTPDDSLERELDEALGSMSLQSLMDEGIAFRPQPAATSAEGLRRGTVIAVQGEDIFVDMGGKSQGYLTAMQFDDEPLPAVGDSIEVTIEGYDRENGLLLLSRKGAVTATTWRSIEEGQIVEGRVIDHNKGGLQIDVDGIRGFIPISQVELFRVEELAPYVNRRLQCQVIEVRQEEKSLVLSRRAVLELEEERTRQQRFESLVEGQTVKGIVRTIMDYGAFVDIGGMDGLLHVSDMSHSRVGHPKDVVHEGQAIEVMVLKVDRDQRKISLGLKQVMPDPWANADVKWPVDDVATGRVTRLAEFGAFVALEDGVEGLIPISELSFERRIHHPGEVVREGEMVRVRVLNVDLERRRIGLSLKRVGDDPWVGASVRWPAHSIAEGVVTRTADFGAFVELAAGVEGLVHISELSENRVRTVGDVVSVGQTIKVKVLEVDEERRRISLSLKQVLSMPDYTGDASTADEPARQPRKRKKPLKGGLEW